MKLRWSFIASIVLAAGAIVAWYLNGSGSYAGQLEYWVFGLALAALIPLAQAVNDVTEGLSPYLGKVSRGLIEAFKTHWELLFQKRMSTLFIWWNLLFPYMDLVYTLVFIPGLILACCGIYWLAGPMTLLVLPMAGLVNYIMFFIQSRMFRAQGLKVRHNPLGLLVYTLFYGIVLQPGCVLGYAAELLKMRKRWGTK